MATIQISSPNSLAPIQRMTSAQRVANFDAQSNSIYTRFSPKDGSTGITTTQPFVYTHISDSSIARNLTKYDSQALPIGSTLRDLERVGKFMVSGTGLLFLGKQYLLQKQNSFNETRIYNPLSLLGATGRAATLGLMERPKRYVESGGSLLGTFLNALKSTVGIEGAEQKISGTAVGLDQNGPFSKYASVARGNGSKSGKWSGVVRFDTAMGASSKFDSVWYGTQANQSSFLQSLKTTFSNLIPSTNPTGDSAGGGGTEWVYRPEYKTGEAGPYVTFLKENPTNLLAMDVTTAPVKQFRTFYNGDTKTITGTSLSPSTFHQYSPKDEVTDEENLYASDDSVKNDTVGNKRDDGTRDNLAGNDGVDGLYAKMLAAIEEKPLKVPQQRMGTHMYDTVEDYNPTKTTYPSYKNIHGQKGGNAKFYDALISYGATALDAQGNLGGYMSSANSKFFAKASGSNQYDRYNALTPTSEDGMKGKRGDTPYKLVGKWDVNQSKDIIFFYFYDLINEIYLPFRATISSLSEQNSADWEDITYMGRADKLFVYKGFSREANFAFTVYANSINELIPMWTRINYLVGLTRPSGYTGTAYSTPGGTGVTTTGQESQFITPPMVTLRLGDLYYDQPCIISSITVNIPDDTNWESFRGDKEYSYLFGPTSNITMVAKSRQLPLKADISVTLKLMEKTQSITSATDRWGINSPL